MKLKVIALLMLLPIAAVSQKYVKFKVGSGRANAAIFSPDKSLLAISQGRQILIYSAGTSTLARKLTPGKTAITSLEFDESGEHLLTINSKTIKMVNIRSGEIVRSFQSTDEVVAGGFLEGDKVAFITRTKLIVYELKSSRILYEKIIPTKSARSFAIGRDYQQIWVGGTDGKLISFKSADGSVLLEKVVSRGWLRAIDTFSERGLVAVGDDRGIVQLITHSGEVSQKLDESRGWINALKFSDDGQYIAIGDDHGDCVLYSIDKNIVTQRITELQYAVRGLAFRNDGRELALIEEFEGVRVVDVSALNIAPVFKLRNTKDIQPPQIFVANPPNIVNDRIRYSEDIISIKGVIIDDSGIQSLKINGIQTPLKDNGNFVMHTPLAMGDNPITIEATDINQNIGIKRFTITRKLLTGEEYDPVKAKNFLFVVGINEYEHWPRLNNAVKDANDLASVLMGQYAFDFSNIVVLKDEQATRNNIFKSLRSFIEKIGPNDNLVIYFSGHGHFDELLNEGYWVPVEANPGSTGEYLSNSDLLKIIGSINSQHTLLVADACFSGALFSDSKRGFIDNVERYKSRWGLASGRLEVVSDGEINKNSPFASALLEFLKTNSKNRVAVSELVQFVKVKVAETASQTPLGSPLRGIGDEGGEFVFYKRL